MWYKGLLTGCAALAMVFADSDEQTKIRATMMQLLRLASRWLPKWKKQENVYNLTFLLNYKNPPMLPGGFLYWDGMDAASFVGVDEIAYHASAIGGLCVDKGAFVCTLVLKDLGKRFCVVVHKSALLVWREGQSAKKTFSWHWHQPRFCGELSPITVWIFLNVSLLWIELARQDRYSWNVVFLCTFYEIYVAKCYEMWYCVGKY